MSTSVLVSSCLLGLPTRYDGTDNFQQSVIDYLNQQQLTPIPICPEQLAGFSTPRPKCWFRIGDGRSVIAGQGKLCDENGRDVTSEFAKAAEESLKIARLCNSQLAILKQRSPSCGSCKVHRNAQLIEGMGVTAARLQAAGLRVLSEDDMGAG